MHSLYFLGEAARKNAEIMEKRAVITALVLFVVMGLVFPHIAVQIFPGLVSLKSFSLISWACFFVFNPLKQHVFRLKLVAREAAIYGLHATPEKCEHIVSDMNYEYHGAIRGTILGIGMDRRVFGENGEELVYFTEDPINHTVK